MSNSSKDKNSGCFLPITLAVIGLLGTLGAALIGNWDKIFMKNSQTVTFSSPTVTVSPTPSSPPPTSRPLVSSPPTIPQDDPVQQSSQVLKGTAIQKGYGSYPMTMYIERRSRTTFSGKLHWTTLRNSITSIDGRFITNFGDVLEQSKWKYVRGFGVDKSGVWLNFTERELLQGNGIVLGVIYYAHLNDDGTMQGVWFNSDKDSEPGGNFEINLSQ